MIAQRIGRAPVNKNPIIAPNTLQKYSANINK
jgi:hypothetical protein